MLYTNFTMVLGNFWRNLFFGAGNPCVKQLGCPTKFIRCTQGNWGLLGIQGSFKADWHEATLPRNYCMQPCYATYPMSNHDVRKLHGKRCTPRLRGKVAPCMFAFTVWRLSVRLSIMGAQMRVHMKPLGPSQHYYIGCRTKCRQTKCRRT